MPSALGTSVFGNRQRILEVHTPKGVLRSRLPNRRPQRADDLIDRKERRVPIEGIEVHDGLAQQRVSRPLGQCAPDERRDSRDAGILGEQAIHLPADESGRPCEQHASTRFAVRFHDGIWRGPGRVTRIERMGSPRYATIEAGWQAVVTHRRALWYSDGGNERDDLPAHVRAGSGLAWIGERLAVVQDDARFVALVTVAGAKIEAIALPRGEGGLRQFDDARGNKKFKLDLEACVAIPGGSEDLLLALGSGSSTRRRHVVRIDRWTDTPPRVQLTDASAWYRRLEQETRFAGSDLNIEGALVADEHLTLVGRGNGAARHGDVPRNATCRVHVDTLLDWIDDPDRLAPPSPGDVAQFDLGVLGGVPLGFTDVAVYGNDVLYTAAAEASADARLDGAVIGSVIGLIPRGDGRPRYAPMTDVAGATLRDKVEGVVVDPTNPRRLLVIIDGDDATRPSELCEVELRGGWGN